MAAATGGRLMPENERIVLSGFRYEIVRGSIREEGKAAAAPVVVATFHDDARGITVEAWFRKEAWDLFLEDARASEGGVVIASREAIEKLGI